MLFQGNGALLRATGIEFVQRGQTLRIDGVKRDVVLSAGEILDLQLSQPFDTNTIAGTIQTPQLLELSGIGNSENLSRHGIRTLVDLPGVGENMRK